MTDSITESKVTDIALTTTFSILVIINLISNTLVCWVVLKHRRMRNVMNYLVVNLAISDIMVALFIAPQYVFRHSFKHPEGTAGDVLCKLVTGGNFIWIGGGASAFTLVAIAIERYFAVSYPHSERSQVTVGRVKCIIIGSWIYAFAFNIPLFFVVNYEKLSNDFRCPEKWPKEIYAKMYTVGAFVVLGAIPIGMMAIFYPLSIRALWKDRLQASTVQSDLIIVRQRKKATKMMCVVSILYAICWLPNLVLYMLSTYEPKYYAYFSTSYVISVALVCANSTMNPFVYSFHSSRFRDELKSILCCIRHGHVDFHRSL